MIMLLFRHSTIRIILSYVVFGVLWIAVSDRVLEYLVTDPHRLTQIQTYKGVGFVAASALLVYFLIRREFRSRARAEEACRESEERFRLLMQHANDGIVLAEAPSGTIIGVNRRIEKITGMPAGNLIGQPLSILHPQADADRCRQLLDEALSAGSAIDGNFCILHRDGGRTPVEISTSIIEVGGKKIVQAIFRDVSRRLAAEEAQQRERARAEQYLDIAAVIIVVIDSEGTVTLINRKGSEILGYPEGEIVGKNWFANFIPARFRENVFQTFRRLMKGELEPAEYFENPVVQRDGSERMIAWHNRLVRDEDGNIAGTISSGEDITARKKAEDQARYRLEHLTTLHAIDLIISSSLDLRITLHEILDLVISQLHVDAAAVLLLNPYTQALEIAARQGFRNSGVSQSRLRLGEGVAGQAALERRIIRVPDLRAVSGGFVRSSLIEGEEFISYFAVPLVAKGQVKGVLDILHRSALDPDEEWNDFLEALAAQAAIAIDNATLFNDLQRSNTELVLAYDSTIEGWARALELRDRETEGHTQRTTEVTLRLARAMGMSEAELVHVRRGALLHDIGKMSIPDSILLKTGPLTEEEWRIMRRHPVYAFELLSPIIYLRPALDIPYCHHERWDGTGYPRGLKGEAIPLAARIFTLADIWDALNSERRYHAAWPPERIREYIRTLSGTQLDPKIVELFLRMDLDIPESNEQKVASDDRP